MACIGAALLLSHAARLAADAGAPVTPADLAKASCSENPQSTSIECPAEVESARPSAIDRRPPASPGADDATAVRELDLEATLPISSSVELPDDI